MDTIAVHGARLSSLALGRRAAPAVVMLHGLVSGNMASWYSSVALALSCSHRVLLYDQRGHGGSSVAATGFDLDGQSRDLLAVLRHYGAEEPVDLVGHSMGALIALRFALRLPQRVRRLVLIDAPMPAGEHVAPSLGSVGSPAALAAYLETQIAAASGLQGRRRERFLQRMSALFFESSLVRDVQDMGAEPDEALAGLEVPVLLVYGTRSPCLAAGRHLHRVLPQAALVLLDCGHYVLEEAPVALKAHLEKFLGVPASIPCASP